jgi:hypothetical protein
MFLKGFLNRLEKEKSTVNQSTNERYFSQQSGENAHNPTSKAHANFLSKEVEDAEHFFSTANNGGFFSPI